MAGERVLSVKNGIVKSTYARLVHEWRTLKDPMVPKRPCTIRPYYKKIWWCAARMLRHADGLSTTHADVVNAFLRLKICATETLLPLPLLKHLGPYVHNSFSRSQSIFTVETKSAHEIRRPCCCSIIIFERSRGPVWRSRSRPDSVMPFNPCKGQGTSDLLDSGIWFFYSSDLCS